MIVQRTLSINITTINTMFVIFTSCTLGRQITKSSSIEASNARNWNPFADDGDSISDDVMFGQEFDRLRCGSESSKFVSLSLTIFYFVQLLLYFSTFYRHSVSE